MVRTWARLFSYVNRLSGRSEIKVHAPSSPKVDDDGLAGVDLTERYLVNPFALAQKTNRAHGGMKFLQGGDWRDSHIDSEFTNKCLGEGAL